MTDQDPFPDLVPPAWPEERDHHRGATHDQSEPGRHSPWVLVGVLAAIALLAWLGKALGTVGVVAALIASIMIHESGHFVTAKLADMKVTEFFVGFGQRLWSTRRGETEYGVKAFFFLGGYNKIIGMSNLEEVDQADEARTYRSKGYLARVAVAAGGSAFQLVLVFVLLWVLFVPVGRLEADMAVGQIYPLRTGPSPAEQAGLKIGDRIQSVDGHRFTQFRDLTPYIQAHPGEPLDFVVQTRGQAPRHTTITPVDLSRADVVGAGITPPSQPTGFIGIQAATRTVRAGPVAALPKALGEEGRIIKTTVKALGGIFSPSGLSDYWSSVTGHPRAGRADNRFLSPVGFVRVASQAADTGLQDVLQLLVIINVFVALFQMVPMLPLDGGHIAVATYEAIRSRPGRRYHADVAKLMPVAWTVVLMLVALGVTSFYLDIVRPAANPFR